MDKWYYGETCKRGHGEGGKCRRYYCNHGCVQCAAERNDGIRYLAPRGRLQSLQINHANRKDALAAGERFYWMLKPCSRGHFNVRYASTGMCRLCQEEINLARRF